MNHKFMFNHWSDLNLKWPTLAHVEMFGPQLKVLFFLEVSSLILRNVIHSELIFYRVEVEIKFHLRKCKFLVSFIEMFDHWNVLSQMFDFNSSVCWKADDYRWHLFSIPIVYVSFLANNNLFGLLCFYSIY